MTVSISNMAQVWMSNTNTYNGIAMSISTMGYGGNSSSRVLKFSVDGNTKFDIDSNGNIVTCNSINTTVLTANTIKGNITGNVLVTTANVTGQLYANSGFGSSAAMYGVRAWVNFNGTGSDSTNQTVRGSGGVSSVYKIGTGNYRIEFSNPMPDTNYAVVGSTGSEGYSYLSGVTVQRSNTTNVTIITHDYNSTQNRSNVYVTVIR